jgi:hypothetical protein
LKTPLTAGRLVYLTYHQPRGWLVRCWREGGPVEQWRDARGRREMITRAWALPPSPAAPEAAPEVHLLTGRRYWYQTALCLYSLRRHDAVVRPVLIDDGSFDAALVAEAHRVFPDVRIERTSAIEAHLDEHLPANKFPTLRAHRRTYVHLRKLIDVHAGRRGWRLVLDSDLLFFRRPDFLIDWLAAPDRSLHMVDVHDSYGYPTSSLAELAGASIPSVVNVGLTGLRSDTIDWERIEFWCRRLIEIHGTSYYLEQAVIAMWLAAQPCAIAPRPDYLVLPSVAECRAPRAIMHHYVAEAKRGYFRHAWRHI